MATTRLTLVGMGNTLRQLARVPVVVKKYAAEAVDYSAYLVKHRAQSIVPVDTGFLKSDIDVQHVAGRLTGFVGVRSPSAYYWYPLEVGYTRGDKQIAARPTFRTAAESESSSFIRQMEDIGPAIEHEMAEGRLL